MPKRIRVSEGKAPSEDEGTVGRGGSVRKRERENEPARSNKPKSDGRRRDRHLRRAHE